VNKQRKLTTQRWVLALALPALLTIGLVGCQSPPPPPPTATPTLEPTPTPPPTATPEPPTLTSEPTPPPSPPPAPVTEPSGKTTVPAGKTIPVRASATDADGYRWRLDGEGEISATEGDTILYTPPEQVGEEGAMALLVVVAYNAHGESPQTSLIISVPGVATLGLDQLDTVPAGWMSGGPNPALFMDFGSSSDNCHTGTNCIKLTYRTGGGWGGIYWWPLACGDSGTDLTWNNVKSGACGVNVLQAGNFGAVDSLTFWARGERGGEVVEFKIGGADIPPMPASSTGKVTLTSDWQPYRIGLAGKDLTNATGLFLWVATDQDNLDGAVFYLDDIQFEGTR